MEVISFAINGIESCRNGLQNHSANNAQVFLDLYDRHSNVHKEFVWHIKLLQVIFVSS